MLKAIFILVNSKQIKQTDLGSTLMLTVQGMKAIGSMMFKKDKVRKLGSTAPSMSVSIETV